MCVCGGGGNNMWPLGRILFLGFFNIKIVFCFIYSYISQNLGLNRAPLVPPLYMNIILKISVFYTASCVSCSVGSNSLS